jgi:hypothetical protein
MPSGLHKCFFKKCPARLVWLKANTWPTLVYTHLLIGSLVPGYLEKQNRRFFKIKELPKTDIPNTCVCLLSWVQGKLELLFIYHPYLSSKDH